MNTESIAIFYEDQGETHRRKPIKTICLCVILLVLTGCTHFTKPLNQPVIEGKLNPRWLSPGRVGTLSLTPERRVVLVNFETNRFCAEGPTESGIDVNKILELAANASKKADLRASFEAVFASARNNTVLNRRSQGMQLFLASSYSICQMYMNGAISDQDAVTLQLEVLNAVRPLIQTEVDLMYRYDAQDPREFKAADPIDVRRIIESLQLDKKESADTQDGE